MTLEGMSGSGETHVVQFRIERGARVLGSDGSHIGAVEQIVVDRDSGVLRAIVIKSAETQREFELAAEHVRETHGDEVRVDLTRDELAAHPELTQPYRADQYVAVDSSAAVQPEVASEEAISAERPVVTDIEPDAAEIVLPDVAAAQANVGLPGTISPPPMTAQPLAPTTVPETPGELADAQQAMTGQPATPAQPIPSVDAALADQTAQPPTEPVTEPVVVEPPAAPAPAAGVAPLAATGAASLAALIFGPQPPAQLPALGTTGGVPVSLSDLQPFTAEQMRALAMPSATSMLASTSAASASSSEPSAPSDAQGAQAVPATSGETGETSAASSVADWAPLSSPPLQKRVPLALGLAVGAVVASILIAVLQARQRNRRPGLSEQLPQVAEKTRAATKELASHTRGATRSAQGSIRNVVAAAQETARDVASAAQENVFGAAATAKETARGAAAKAQKTARQAAARTAASTQETAGRAKQTAKAAAANAGNAAQGLQDRQEPLGKVPVLRSIARWVTRGVQAGQTAQSVAQSATQTATQAAREMARQRTMRTSTTPATPDAWIELYPGDSIEIIPEEDRPLRLDIAEE